VFDNIAESILNENLFNQSFLVSLGDVLVFSNLSNGTTVSSTTTPTKSKGLLINVPGNYRITYFVEQVLTATFVYSSIYVNGVQVLPEIEGKTTFIRDVLNLNVGDVLEIRLRVSGGSARVNDLTVKLASNFVTLT